MNNPLFRPPAEAESLILQVDQGCPHNRCTFCGMYRGLQYRRRPVDEVRPLILREARRFPDAQRVFLADGDVMLRPFDELEAILAMLGDSLPRLARVSLYANGSSITAKSEKELRNLRALKLHTLYMGLESGDEDILQRCRKGETAVQMVCAGRAAQAAGLRLSVMVLLGLGGDDRSEEHVKHTASALNRMQPRLLSALRMVPVEGTELREDVARGRFRPLTEHQVVRELRELVDRLELSGTVFRANHSSNVVPLEARFPRDKARLLAELDALLASGKLDELTSGRLPLWL
ncbi:radical SAM protein [Verrucomicrobiota bacterium]